VLLEGVTHRATRVVEFYSGRDPRKIDETVNAIKRLAASGQPVAVGLNWTGNKGHKILVEKIDGASVSYTNPYGTKESMTLDELKRRITNANLPE